MIRFPCHQCKRPLGVRDHSLVGRRIKCPGCEARSYVPEQSLLPEPTAVRDSGAVTAKAVQGEAEVLTELEWLDEPEWIEEKEEGEEWNFEPMPREEMKDDWLKDDRSRSVDAWGSAGKVNRYHQPRSVASSRHRQPDKRMSRSEPSAEGGSPSFKVIGGLAICAVGIVATVHSYENAEPGGQFVMWTGAIVWGFSQCSAVWAI